MEQILLIFLGIITTSCYFFPFILIDFPVANSKMIMAAIGLLLIVLKRNQINNEILKDFITLSIWALGVSFASLFSTIFNNTRDNTYVSYIISMWVWLGGAYCAVSVIKHIHGTVSIQIVSKYLIAVCVMQCLLALLFEYSGAANSWHNRFFGGNEGYMGAVSDGSRLHGIGCALDVAGFRFAAVISIALYLYFNDCFKEKENLLVLLGIGIIVVVGDMISRSTFIGLAIGLGYWVLTLFNKYKENNKVIFKYFFCALFIVIISTVYFYHTNQSFHNNLRFGFEGFFSYFETGKWESQSNNILRRMIIWPDNLHTWLVGDGYIVNPMDKSTPAYDPYYIGEESGGYYKGTDIGYLRFIFYFGLIGLTIFVGFFVEACRICINRFPNFLFLFILILCVNFVEWFKVSTDLFVVFAPFLCITRKEEDEAEKWEGSLQNDDNSLAV